MLWQSFFKTRLEPHYLIELFIVPLVLFDFNPNMLSLISGLLVFFVGLLLKLWLFSYAADPDGQFSIFGPFRFLRFPNYLCSFLICMAIIICARAFYILPIFFICYALVFLFETKKLDKKRCKEFGLDYLNYRDHVSGLIPGFLPYPTNTSLKSSIRHIWAARLKPEIDTFAITMLFFCISLLTIQFQLDQLVFTLLPLVALLISLQRLWVKLEKDTFRYGTNRTKI